MFLFIVPLVVVGLVWWWFFGGDPVPRPISGTTFDRSREFRNGEYSLFFTTLRCQLSHDGPGGPTAVAVYDYTVPEVGGALRAERTGGGWTAPPSFSATGTEASLRVVFSENIEPEAGGGGAPRVFTGPPEADWTAV